MTHISIKNLSLFFKIYHDKSPSFKDLFSQVINGRKYNKLTNFAALKGINIEISKGTRLGIVGNNGAGKSTLLKTICNVYEADSGVVKTSGRIAPLLEIGSGFHPEFTGRENIYLNGTILGYSKQELQAIEHEVINFSELSDFIDTPVKYYSTGMYMRLAFSLATAVKPDILILDEIFAGGDINFVNKARDRLNSLIDTADIMILVSHDINILRSMCNRILWLDHGSIVDDGPVDPVIDAYVNNNL